MLRKLLKYDFKANGIYFMILYAVLLGYSALFCLFVRTGGDGLWEELTMLAAISGFCFLIAGVSIMTTVLIVVRFYKNMFGPEGYLTHTLPVSPAVQLSSKFISAILWNVLTMAVCGLGIWIASLGKFGEAKEFLWSIIKGVYLDYNGSIYWVYGISMTVSMVTGIMALYLAMCLGQLVNRHRVLCSIGFYVAYVVIRQVIEVVLSVLEELARGVRGLDYPDLILHEGISMGINVVFLIGAFFLCHYLIAHKLNLE